MIEAPLSAAYLKALAMTAVDPEPAAVPELTWHDMSRTPSLLPEPPATPQTPMPLLLIAATVPAVCVPWPESPSPLSSTTSQEMGPFVTKLYP